MVDVVALFSAIVGAQFCLSGDDAREKYDYDITRQYLGKSLCVLRPANTAEVAAILKIANEHLVPVVPQSGNTGLAGGASISALQDTIILSTDRMNRILDINPVSRVAKVEAGVVLANLHAAVAQHGLTFPLLFGARGSCMIGGNLSTNAGGSNVVRYGNTRALCLGLEVVTPAGEIVNLMSELHKDNTGYDLKDLFIGAEGTLGVITAAVLKLVPTPKAYATAMVSVPSIDTALALLHKIQAVSGGAVEAFEYMPRNYFRRLAMLDPNAPMPFAKPAEIGILIEVAAASQRDAIALEDGSIPVQNTLLDTLSDLMETGEVLDATVATSEAQRLEMWRQREMAFEVAHSAGTPVTTDITVPLDKVAVFLTRANIGLMKLAPKAELIEVAHLGDGNVHYTMCVDPDDKGPVAKALQTAIYEMVEDVLADLGGSFSAEHGIGVAKLGSMARRKNPAALAVMRMIKAALDPNNIMNPGKVLP
ncbi:MAG: FAD-binding oxidoreductase [Rhodobacterales bacterium]|jgi:FAD/FMN-containing dehydrogenase